METQVGLARPTRKGSLAASKAVQEQAAKRRLGNVPIVLAGITSPGKLLTITPSLYPKLDIDATYQRGETRMVQKILAALVEGGEILDPVTLCRRPWSADPSKLWIVDGHQRSAAAMQAEKSFPAIVHDSADLASEQRFFAVLNSREKVDANVAIHGWAGPSAAMLRAVNVLPEHPLFDRVNFKAGTNMARVDASVLLRGALVVASGVLGGGRDSWWNLNRLDGAVAEASAKERVRVYLRLLGVSFPKGRIRAQVATAFALVARERWGRDKTNLSFPTSAEITRLVKINWETTVPAFTEKFRVILVEKIRNTWKG